MRSPSLSDLVRRVLLSEASQRGVDPRDVLRRIGSASEEAHLRALGRPHPVHPDFLQDGTFGADGPAPEVDAEGMLVLRRVAGNREGILKGRARRRASLSDLMSQMEFHGGGGDTDAISLSMDPAFSSSYGIGRHATRTVGTFRISPDDLIDMIKRGEAILGNIGEREITASGRSMAPYLVSVEQEGDEDAGVIYPEVGPPKLSDDVSSPLTDVPPPPPPHPFNPF